MFNSMFSYYLTLGVRSLRRNPVLTALMILTLAVGVAATVSTMTILHVMAGDPIPGKSERLFVPMFDNGPRDAGYVPGEEPGDEQLSYRDARNLLASGQGVRRTAVNGISASIEPARTDIGAFRSDGLTTDDFFTMFEAPFMRGQAWSEAEDAAGADVVVLNRGLAEKLFGNANPVGQRMRMMGFDFQVVGVLDHWQPVPRFYRIIGGEGAFGLEDEFMIPMASAIRHEAGISGSMSCSADRGPGFQALLDSECTWIQFWFETASASGRADLLAYLDAYAGEQRKQGRLLRAAPNHVYDVMQWLEHRHVVGNDSRLSVWLAFGFLLLCLVNTIGLLLAKFSVRAAEVGIRRALGASRADVFRQFLVETGVVGIAGGVLGLVLARASLALIARQSDELGTVAHMDWSMLGLTFALSLLAALLAGVLPTWRACQVTPAIQLKSQ